MYRGRILPGLLLHYPWLIVSSLIHLVTGIIMSCRPVIVARVSPDISRMSRIGLTGILRIAVLVIISLPGSLRLIMITCFVVCFRCWPGWVITGSLWRSILFPLLLPFLLRLLFHRLLLITGPNRLLPARIISSIGSIGLLIMTRSLVRIKTGLGSRVSPLIARSLRVVGLLLEMRLTLILLWIRILLLLQVRIVVMLLCLGGAEFGLGK